MSTPGPTSTRTRRRAVHHLNNEPQSGPLCRMGPQSREGLHSVLIFMRRFWQQFTHRGNFKQNSGCEWISATNQFCPKPELAIVGKKMLQPQTIGGCRRGCRAATISGRCTLLKQSVSPPWRQKLLTCQETCLSHKLPPVVNTRRDGWKRHSLS